MALEEEVPELGPGDDKTLPRFRQIDKRAGPYVVDWGRELEEAYYDWVDGKGEKVEVGTKRGGEGKAEGKVKRVKENSLDEVERLAKEGKVGTATVAVLKDFLAARGLNVGGKKAELVERVEELFVAKDGKVGTATVAVLKDFLAARGLNVGGKKAELVERVEEVFENK
ncbi:hypothetical protein V495_01413 [Pseudogymnoascus sp. VKM F-4514 (FW-929)]|nr:hypothetical protein V495_01413 [Pseudogymnoascus sp. VKM F-4514 (FW-929)]